MWKSRIILAMVLSGFMCMLAFAAYDHVAVPKQPDDLINFVIQVPRAEMEKHGFTERTVILFNLITFKEACLSYEKRISALERKVKKIEVYLNTIPDPNSVK